MGGNSNLKRQLLYFNKIPTSKTNINIDKTFVELLLLSVFNVNSLKRGDIDDDLLNIVKCNIIFERNDFKLIE